jgi:hypothetical protein
MKKTGTTKIVLLAAAFLANPATAQRLPRAGPDETPSPVALKNPPLAKGNVEKKILSVLDDLDRTHRYRWNISMADGRLLRVLTESIGAKHVVELGTYNGYSAIWLALGLRTPWCGSPRPLSSSS